VVFVDPALLDHQQEHSPSSNSSFSSNTPPCKLAFGYTQCSLCMFLHCACWLMMRNKQICEIVAAENYIISHSSESGWCLILLLLTDLSSGPVNCVRMKKEAFGHNMYY